MKSLLIKIFIHYCFASILFSGIHLYAQEPGMGDYIIHIYHPWFEDTVYNSYGLKIQCKDNYYPGADLSYESGFWYEYVYSADQQQHTAETWEIALFYTQNDYLMYDVGLSIDTIFTDHPDQNEVWLIPRDTSSFPEISFDPPECKVVHFLNPWPNSVPRILLESVDESQRMRINYEHCGWFTKHYYKDVMDTSENDNLDTLRCKFVNAVDSSDVYTSDGLNPGGYIDVTGVLSSKDTVWVHPNPSPYGPPVVSTEFPEVLGECPYRDLSAIVRDQRADGTAFQPEESSGLVEGMVADTLTLSGDIIKGNGEVGSDSIENWFDEDKSIHDTCINITLEKTYDGMWLYDSDWDKGFFPIDNFDNPNNESGFQDNTGTERNFHFTMEMWMDFIYHEGSGQTFIFRGDDDVWVFVDRWLTFDIGGIHGPIADTVNLDSVQPDLGLVDGERYSMAIFFCERQTSGSNFLVKTSIDLQSSSNLRYKATELDQGGIRYDIYEIITTQQLDCGQNTFSGEEQPVISKFTISGPQFQEPLEMGAGVNFGGIDISSDSTYVTVDTSSITGLISGTYTITYTHSRDSSKSGSVTFVVASHRAEMPDTDPPPGEYSEEISVTYTCATPGARIYYTRDHGVTFPGDENISGTSWMRYTDPILLETSDTLYAVAVSDSCTPSYTSVSQYQIEIPAASKPEVSPPPGEYQTMLIDTVTLSSSTEGAEIYYTFDSSIPFSDTSWTHYAEENPLSIEYGRSLYAVAVAEGYKRSEILEAEYVLDLPAADPPVISPPGGVYYENITGITISTDYTDAKLYYTFNDTARFSPESDIWHEYNTGDSLEMTSTGSIRAVAVKYGLKPSQQVRETYTIRFPRGIGGAYIDSDGDGSIDKAVIELDTTVDSELPENIYLFSPFDKKVVDTADQGDMNWLDNDYTSERIEVRLASPFPFTNETYFVQEDYVRIASEAYDSSWIPLSDSVAPVLVSAKFTPPSVDRETCEYTGSPELSVEFSESVGDSYLNGTEEYFTFLSRSTGQLYSMHLTEKETNGHTIRFRVDNLTGITYPENGDSVRIMAGKVGDYSGNTQLFEKNRAVSLTVEPKECCIKTKRLSVFEPGKTPIPESIINSAEKQIDFNTGTFIVCDPNTVFHQQILDASVTIFDLVGNTVAHSSGRYDIQEKSVVVSGEKEENSKDRLFIFWDGRNMNNRYAGSGTYYFLIQYSTVNYNSNSSKSEVLRTGKKESQGIESVFIGIRR